MKLTGIAFLFLLHLIDADIDHFGQRVTHPMTNNVGENKTKTSIKDDGENGGDHIQFTNYKTTVTWSSTTQAPQRHSTTTKINEPPLLPQVEAVSRSTLSNHGAEDPDAKDRRDIDRSITTTTFQKLNSGGINTNERIRSKDELESQQQQQELPLTLASSSSSRVTGPYFESNKTTMFISTRAGQTVIFDCSVVLLQGRTVSWLRKRKDNLQLLTVGNTTYYSDDSRVGLRFRYPNNWRLAIEMVRKSDESEYQCQLSTHPPKALIYHLKVIAPAVQIFDENGHVLVNERHYRQDSSLHLTCKASHVDKSLDNIVWLKGDLALPGFDSRIKVKLSKGQNGGEATGYLSVLSVRKGDTGNYTCKASSLASASIFVHVLNGELPAAVQHENSGNSLMPGSRLSPFVWIFSSLSLLISTLATTTSTLHMRTKQTPL